ncbi:MAG: glycosyl hydrolase, partial [Bacteroidales bacterium]|nr:glycosyl hydrolase [Bacteroidales bacterium]
MKSNFTTIRNIVFIALIITPFLNLKAQSGSWRDTSLTIDRRVDILIDQLTLDEKLSLMVHQNPAIERVGLPAYSWWNEALHGVGRAGIATVYPMPIALAATFDPVQVQCMFARVTYEARRKYHEAQDTGYYGDYAGLTYF